MVAALRLRSSHTWADDDARPLLLSWAIALAFGIAWLLIVYLTPAAVVGPTVAGPSAEPTIIGFLPGRLPLAVKAGDPGAPTLTEGRQAHPHAPSSPLVEARAFTGTVAAVAVERISQLLSNAIASHGDIAVPSSEKRALLTDVGGSTPGMAQLSRDNGAATGRSLGQVQNRAAIAHTEVRVRDLPTVTAPPLGTEMVNGAEMGAFVRGRAAQLQTCYDRTGGDLAGVVALRLTIGPAGAVQSAEIVRRTWSGPAAAATEACLLDMARRWHVPFGADGATITLPISFTRGT